MTTDQWTAAEAEAWDLKRSYGVAGGCYTAHRRYEAQTTRSGQDHALAVIRAFWEIWGHKGDPVGDGRERKAGI